MHSSNTVLPVTICIIQPIDPLGRLRYRSVRELLFNCAKHAEAKQVRFEMSRRTDFVEVAIADDGTGFQPDRLNIFGGKEGGFGLFTIKEQVTAIGGSFKLHSSPGEGCRVVLNVPFGLAGQTFPVDQVPQIQVIDNPAVCGKRESNPALSILIADDHAVVRQGMVSLLRNQPGFDVIGEATDGEQAVRMALQFRPGVVLMDLSMPLLNGVDATRKIKAAAPGIAVIGLTMFSDADTVQRMLNAGAKDCLAKDVQAAALVKTIRKCV